MVAGVKQRNGGRSETKEWRQELNRGMMAGVGVESETKE